MTDSANRKISPNKKFCAEVLHTVLQVGPHDVIGATYALDLLKYDLPFPEIFRWSSDSKAIGMVSCKFAENFAGIWFPLSGEFYQTSLPKRFRIDSIEVLPNERILVCSSGGEVVKTIKMPDSAALTKWEKQVKDLEKASFRTEKQEWIWNETAGGYEGVHLREGVVLWFQHSHNPHAGGGALEQSFEDFLNNGPACRTPPEFLPELYHAVRKLSEAKAEL
ncbi:MAG: hypothetical protein R2747_16010 [Pyrinomonadaceae bacterium]